MQVTQVTETIKVEPNKVYVIPPAKHLEMSDGFIALKEPKRVKGAPVSFDLNSLIEERASEAQLTAPTACGSNAENFSVFFGG